MIPQPIETAPAGDGWILGLVEQDGAPEGFDQPWQIVTRCDNGWCDDIGCIRTPTLWVPLPNPQPRPTGWRRAKGVVRIIKGWSSEIKWKGWLVEVILPDGDVDPDRECIMADTIERARGFGNREAALLGLPLVEVDDVNVLPLVPR